MYASVPDGQSWRSSTQCWKEEGLCSIWSMVIGTTETITLFYIFSFTERKRVHANIASLPNRKWGACGFLSGMLGLWWLVSSLETSQLLVPFCPSVPSGPRAELLTMDGFRHLSLLPDEYLPPLPAFSVKFLLLGVFLLELYDSLLQPPQGVVREDQGSRKVVRNLPKYHILYLQIQNKANGMRTKADQGRTEGKA